MTHKVTLPSPGSSAQSNSARFLADAIAEHCAQEKASFHTPGHKGRIAAGVFEEAGALCRFDVTELPLTDELASPATVLSCLEQRASALWRSKHTLLSVNGASAALMAAILACAPRGRSILVPTNAHRSVIQALVLSGLDPVWYEPNWDGSWGFWTNVDAEHFGSVLSEHKEDLAAAVVVSPTYAGDASDIARLSRLCRQARVPLIVDEAHGAHLVAPGAVPPHAVAQGAQLSVNSLHKTLGAFTQTALLHIGEDADIDIALLRSALNLLHTSSPSYLLLTSIDETIRRLEADCGQSALSNIVSLRVLLTEALSASPDLEIYTGTGNTDPAHIAIRVGTLDAQILFTRLCARGIYPETVLGRGVLFLLGEGNNRQDIELLARVLKETEPAGGASTPGSRLLEPPGRAAQILLPRQAFFAPSQTVAASEAVGKIASDCFAPCPPGTPLVIPGQRIPPEILSFSHLPALRVVIESPIQGEN